ncbi:MAG TPA: hypothetical protein VGO96_13550 [Pyrinomonadaceae bacterium]|nr:hypothetical protein [Pyrinomonadaceae bacterium]
MKNSSHALCSLSLRVFVAACLLCVTNCGGAGSSGEANQPSGDHAARNSAPASSGNAAQPSPNPERVETPPAHGAQRGSGVLIDYRNEQPDNKPPLIEARFRRRIVQAAYGAKAAPDDYSINSSASGSFTRQGVRETVYLLQRGGPVAADPNGAQDLWLVVFDASDQLVAKFKTADFNFIAATSDTDGDGVHELLLEGSFFNMGTLGSSARLVELKSKQLRAIKTFEGVYENPCEGDPDSHLTAAAINYGAGGGDGQPPTFKVSFYRAPCPARGGKPSFDSFQPAPDPGVKR